MRRIFLAGPYTGGRASANARRVYDWIASRGEWGATYCEVVDHFGDDSMQRRLSELVTKVLVADSGRRRPSWKGRPCVVWIVDQSPPGE